MGMSCFSAALGHEAGCAQQDAPAGVFSASESLDNRVRGSCPATPPDQASTAVGVERAVSESFQRPPGEREVARTRRGGRRRQQRGSVRAQLGLRRRSDQPTGSVAHQGASPCESSPISSSGVHRIGASAPRPPPRKSYGAGSTTRASTAAAPPRSHRAKARRLGS